MTLHGQQILGASLSAESTQRFAALNPTSGETLPGEFAEASAAEVDRALQLAASASRSYRALDAERRAAFLERCAEEIEGLGDELFERTEAETALPRGRLQMERGRTCGQLRLFAQVVRDGAWVDARIDRAEPERQPIPKPELRRMLRPVGPVVVFGASNFPLAFSVAGGDTASALAAGCPVVVKAHPKHPGCSELVGSAIRRAVEACDLPEGVFSLVHGEGHEVGLALVRHAATKAVGFTGSLAGGRALCDAAAARDNPIPVFAEMGSTNPLFVLPEALTARGEAIASALCQSVQLGVGQFCTNPGIVFVVDGDAAQGFVDSLQSAFEAADAATMLHAGIHSAYSAGVERFASINGVDVLAHGAAGEAACAATPHAFATMAATWLAKPELAQELFGPATLVVRCKDRDELIACAEALEGQLTTGLFADAADAAFVDELVPILEDKAGRILREGFPTGVEVCASMQHGGPWPATSDSRSTSVGTAAILRFARPVCWQGPFASYPAELEAANPRGILRMINGVLTRDAIG